MLFERFLAEVDKKPFGKKPDNTPKAPDNIQKSPAPFKEEEINAKRMRATAPEFIPTLFAMEPAEDRPIQSASCMGESMDANDEVQHGVEADGRGAQQMHSRRVSEVTVCHTSRPEREPPSVKIFMAERRIMREQVRTVLRNLKASGCDTATLKQVQWGDVLRGIAATVLAEIEAEDKDYDIIDLDPQPAVQPGEKQPPISPSEHTDFALNEKVVLHGLVKRPDLNGRAGIVFEKPGVEGRVPVEVIPVLSGGYEVKISELIRAKPENLRRPTPGELAAYFKEFW